jgi:RHS repeat-associated protein
VEARQQCYLVRVNFKYDPFGRRIYKSSSNGTSIFAYDGGNLAEETNSSGSVVARYAQGVNIDTPLALQRSSATSYYETDGLGSVTSLTNSAGAISASYTYDSFGNVITSSGSPVNPFRYTARELDSETNLYYYRARYYDSETGRFLNEDPLGFAADTNFFSYVGNRPTMMVDPTGRIHQAWFEPPFDGRLHDDPGAGLEVLCINPRTRARDIVWLEHSIAVRGAEITLLGNKADKGHLDREASERAKLASCKDCDKEEPTDEPIPIWEEVKKTVKRHKVEFVVVGAVVVVATAVALAPATGGASLVLAAAALP